MARLFTSSLSIVCTSFILSACSTNPPEDPRYDSFATGLPEQHAEHTQSPYPVKPFVPGKAKAKTETETETPK